MLGWFHRLPECRRACEYRDDVIVSFVMCGWSISNDANGDIHTAPRCRATLSERLLTRRPGVVPLTTRDVQVMGPGHQTPPWLRSSTSQLPDLSAVHGANPLRTSSPMRRLGLVTRPKTWSWLDRALLVFLAGCATWSSNRRETKRGSQRCSELARRDLSDPDC